MRNNYSILKDNYTYNHEGVREFSELSVHQYFALLETGNIASHQSVDSAPTPDEIVTLAFAARQNGSDCWLEGYEKLGEVFINAIYIEDGSCSGVRDRFFDLADNAFVIEDGNEAGSRYLFARWLHVTNQLPAPIGVRVIFGIWNSIKG